MRADAGAAGGRKRPSPERTSDTDTGGGAAIGVVLADDNPLYREGLAELLGEQERLTVVAAVDSGAEAVEACAQHGADLLLAELRLPGLQGAELVEQVLEASPRTRVVVFSSQLDAGTAWRVLQSGANGLLSKDATLPELLDAALAVHGGGTFLCPLVQDLIVRGAIRDGQRGSGGRWAELSRREREVATLLVEGLNPRQIADRLSLKVKTVDSHRYQLLQKLELRNVADLTRLAVLEGVIDP